VDDARPGFDQTLFYDALDRLEEVQGFGANVYGYDASGNRTSKSNPALTYVYDATNGRL
jgi:hypothetical protein